MYACGVNMVGGWMRRLESGVLAVSCAASRQIVIRIDIDSVE